MVAVPVMLGSLILGLRWKESEVCHVHGPPNCCPNAIMVLPYPTFTPQHLLRVSCLEQASVTMTLPAAFVTVSTAMCRLPRAPHQARPPSSVAGPWATTCASLVMMARATPCLGARQVVGMVGMGRLLVQVQEEVGVTEGKQAEACRDAGLLHVPCVYVLGECCLVVQHCRWSSDCFEVSLMRLVQVPWDKLYGPKGWCEADQPEFHCPCMYEGFGGGLCDEVSAIRGGCWYGHVRGSFCVDGWVDWCVGG